MVAWSRSCLRLPENASFVFLALFKHVASTRSFRMRGTFNQPAFMGSCLLVTRVCPVYLVDTLVLVFLVLLK